MTEVDNKIKEMEPELKREEQMQKGMGLLNADKLANSDLRIYCLF
jgi:hypothetical protein